MIQAEIFNLSYIFNVVECQEMIKVENVMNITVGSSQYIMLCNGYSFKVFKLHLQVLINMNEYIARDRISQSSDLIIVDSRTQSALQNRRFELIDELPYPITLWTGMDEDNT